MSQPLKAIRHRSNRRAAWSAALAWLAPALFWIVVILAVKSRDVKTGSSTHGPLDAANATGTAGDSNEQEVTTCDTDWQPEVIIVAVVVMFYAPLAAIFVLFGLIMCVLRRHMVALTVRMRVTTSLYDQDPCTSDNPPSADASSTAARSKARATVRSETVSAGGGASRQQQVRRPCRHVSINIVSSDSRGEATDSPTNSGSILVRAGCRPTPPDPRMTYGSRDCSARTPLCPVDRHWRHSDTMLEYTPAPRTGSDATVLPVRCLSRAAGGTAQPEVPDAVTPKWRRYACRLREQRQVSLQESRLRQQVRAAKTLGAITACLLLCWLPFTVCVGIEAFCPRCLGRRAFDMAAWINYLNSAINPVIYCLSNAQYRLAIGSLVRRAFRCRWVVCRGGPGR